MVNLRNILFAVSAVVVFMVPSSAFAQEDSILEECSMLLESPDDSACIGLQYSYDVKSETFLFQNTDNYFSTAVNSLSGLLDPDTGTNFNYRTAGFCGQDPHFRYSIKLE